MKNTFLILFVLFGFTSFATPKSTPFTDASLNGTYSFQVSGVHLDSWGLTQTCYDAQGFPHSTSIGGQVVDTTASVGTAVFDGSGHVSGTITTYGQFDFEASNATVVLSCAGATDNGHPVYKTSSAAEFTGTYTIQPDGTGAMTLSFGDGFILRLAGEDKGISSKALIMLINPDHSVGATGVAVLQ
ncbi:MAG TPA: hypothetical protein VFJ47_13195 [Terriglobales bacterium]|nr:hypothetical protein [Terriglobales bacterium]